MVSAETLVTDPEEIRTLSQADSFLLRIVCHENSHGDRAGVLLTQRRQFGSLYEIASESGSYQELKKAVRQDLPEFGIAYYPRTYFEALRKRLEGKDIRLPEPLRRFR